MSFGERNALSIILINLTKKEEISSDDTQQAFTCSKSITERVEKVVKYIQSLQQRYQNDFIDVIVVCLLLTLNKLHAFFKCLYRYIWA